MKNILQQIKKVIQIYPLKVIVIRQISSPKCREDDNLENVTDKVTVVGAGMVGMASALSILTQGISKHLVLVDLAKDRLEGETLDLQHGAIFLKDVQISSSTDYSITTGSKICLINAGASQKVGESRQDLVQRNADIMKNIIPNLAKYSPQSILIMITNPCDILSYVTWKLSGFPTNRVFGIGTTLDTSRFRLLLSQKHGVPVSKIQGWVIGEHGDTSVPVWCSVYVNGIRLQDSNPNIGTEKDPENYSKIHKQVVDAAYKIIKLKGYTNWAIGMSTAAICKSILQKEYLETPLSTNIKDMYGIKEDLFLSLPVILGKDGINEIKEINLTAWEMCRFQKGVSHILELQNKVKF